jgi:hypothetical protein
MFKIIYLFETGSHYIAQAGLELSILLPQPPECWDYRHVPPPLAEIIKNYKTKSACSSETGCSNAVGPRCGLNVSPKVRV